MKKTSLWALLAAASFSLTYVIGCGRPIIPVAPIPLAQTATATITLSPNPTNTNSPTYTVLIPLSTDTFTPTPTLTPTSSSTPVTSVGTATETFTQTFSSTETPTITPSATQTVTYTPTGCSKMCYSANPLPVNPVSAGTTVVGFYFSGSQGCGSYSCGVNPPQAYMTNISFSVTFTGNLNTQINQVELWGNGAFVTMGSFSSSGFTFTGSPLCAANLSFELKYVLSPTALGSIQTSLDSEWGYQQGYPPGSSGAVLLPVKSGVLTVQ